MGYNIDTIKKVISIIHYEHPGQGVGNYISHVPNEDGRGVLVKLTNGTIIVTYAAMDDVLYHATIPGYANAMLKTFKKDFQPPPPRLTTWQKILKILTT